MQRTHRMVTVPRINGAKEAQKTLEEPRDFDCRSPPPPGGSPIWQAPNQEPRGRGPPSKNLYQVLRGRSSSSGFVVREPVTKGDPPGLGGGSCDHLYRLKRLSCQETSTQETLRHCRVSKRVSSL